MPDSQTPALTPTQWQQVDGLHLNYNHLIQRNSVPPVIPYQDQHAAAAMLLYGQPYGFSWDMVDALERIVRNAPRMISPVDNSLDFANQAIANMKALLPPR